MATTNPTTLTTASVLAFERKLDPSDALLYSGPWDRREDSGSWPAIGVREKSVRGTISNRLKTKGKDIDPAKLDAEIEKPNLQTVDVATMPANADTLKCRFTLRVLGGAGTPSACNNTAYQARLVSVVSQYRDAQGFGELARRYAINLANARFLWRNRVGAEQVEVRINHVENGKAVRTWTFEAFDFSLHNFDVPAAHQKALTELASVIEKGLSGQAYALLDVTAFARVGDGQEVFPSQELILDKGSDRGGAKSKTLYAVALGDVLVAGMHSQKIGNALRTVDTWYPESQDTGPIPVEPYGSVTAQGKAYRQPKAKMDFYSLLDGWMIKDQTPTPDQQHYVLATLIRGGVFGESGKE